jgi:hypothetical protein
MLGMKSPAKRNYFNLYWFSQIGNEEKHEQIKAVWTKPGPSFQL